MVKHKDLQASQNSVDYCGPCPGVRPKGAHTWDNCFQNPKTRHKAVGLAIPVVLMGVPVAVAGCWVLVDVERTLVVAVGGGQQGDPDTAKHVPVECMG